ncbi:hypothetical protein BDV35DRAFT_358836 [Aspergillus flavus]|uniref:Uncharacterized protein n=1 Tax=Aspergillus flavus TaxID=5059 RepID=A0A5N6GUT6_ASPFL|nr:hypothetical protein BDV35DRAFT_358836 [Aspergillus flavus]
MALGLSMLYRRLRGSYTSTRNVSARSRAHGARGRILLSYLFVLCSFLFFLFFFFCPSFLFWKNHSNRCMPNGKANDRNLPLMLLVSLKQQ